MGQFAAETDSTYELREPQTLAALPLGPCLASGSAMSAIQAPPRLFSKTLGVWPPGSDMFATKHINTEARTPRSGSFV